jgi:NAD+ diphosphatase
MMEAFIRCYPPQLPTGTEHVWYVLRGDEFVVDVQAPAEPLRGNAQMPQSIAVAQHFPLGHQGDVAVHAAVVAADCELSEGLQTVNLRNLMNYQGVRQEVIMAASYAKQLIEFCTLTRFCSRCGAAYRSIPNTWGLRCDPCKHEVFPPVSPAIIVLIHDGDRVLLTTKVGWGDRYSLVAGFAEPGESFEACVAREVREEVGVEVGKIRYVGSQCWPFPHQVMVGFLAQYASGTIAMDASELADARWFHRNDMPAIPPPTAISGQILDIWLRGEVATGMIQGFDYQDYA